MTSGRRRVYLSSTFDDLREYRSAVFAGLDKAGLNVARMEAYTAADQRPVDWCLRDVAECDVYVGLFAWRYGYKPPITDNPTGMSVTELEYREAERSRLRTLVFLADPSTLAHWPASYVDSAASDDGKQLAALRRELVEQKTVAFFHTPDELATLVLAALMRTGLSRRPYNIPLRPPGLVARPALIERLVSAVVSGETTAGRKVVVHGGGGFGKTTLALEGCHRPELVQMFSEGMLWATLGQNPDLPQVLGDLYVAATGEQAKSVGADGIRNDLVNALKGRRCVLVLDDVWRAADTYPFLELSGPTLVVTTRISNLPEQTRHGAWFELNVDEMTADEAQALLGRHLTPDVAVAHKLRTLADQLGCWPLLLDLASARLLEEVKARAGDVETSVRRVTTVLERAGVLGFDRFDGQARNHAVAATVDVGLTFAEQTVPGVAKRAAELAVFPEDVGTPVRALADLWAMDSFDVEEHVLRPLDSLSVLRWDRSTNQVQLHDVVRRVLASRLADSSAVHGKLLDAWGDPYRLPHAHAWRWFAWHCIRARQLGRMYELVFDLEWLAAKLHATDVDALLRDFDRVLEALRGYESTATMRQDEVAPLLKDTEHLQSVLLRSAYILARHPELLGQQLAGRITRESASCQKLLDHVNRLTPSHVLLSLTPSLASRGAACREIVRHNGVVLQLALTDDGRAVTAGSDGQLFCVPLHEGEMTRLAQYAAAITALILTPDGRVVTGGSDGKVYCVPLDGGEPEQIAQHEGEVTRLALTGDGRVVTGGSDGHVYCATLGGGQPARVAQNKGRITALLVTNDGGVVAGGSDGQVYSARLEGGGQIPIALHASEVTDLALTSGNRVVTAGFDGHVYCASLEDGASALLAKHAWGTLHLRRTRDGRVVSGGGDGRIICSSPERDESVLVTDHDGRTTALALTDDGRIVVGCRDGRLLCTKLDRDSQVPLVRHKDKVIAIVLTRDGQAISAGADGRVYCASLDGGKALHLVRHFHRVDDRYDPDRVTHLALTRDGRVVTAGPGGRVYCASLSSSEDLLDLVRHQDRIAHLMLTADGRVITGGNDGLVCCTSLENGRSTWLAQHEGRVSQLAVASGGRVVSGGKDGQVYCSSPDAGAPVPLACHEAEISQLVVTRDDRVVSGGRDGTVRCTSLRDGNSLIIARRRGAVLKLSSTSGNRVVAYTGHGRVYSADVDREDPVPLLDDAADMQVTADDRVVMADRNGRVYCAFVGGGQEILIGEWKRTVKALLLTGDGRVVIGDAGGAVYCTSLDGGQPRLLVQHEAEVLDLVLSSDGQVISRDLLGCVFCAALDGAERVVVAKGGVWQLAPTRDGRLVMSDWFGEVHCARLDGADPVRLAPHDYLIRFALTDDGRAVTSLDATLWVTDLSAPDRQSIFASDAAFTQLAYEATRRVVVAADESGGLHVLPLQKR